MTYIRVKFIELKPRLSEEPVKLAHLVKIALSLIALVPFFKIYDLLLRTLVFAFTNIKHGFNCW